ncbi:MAG: ATP-binding cassette domain-containing protein, partial [Armatimonadota bacterium]|nr:ATP-binding cassette domain-containing protein [Armatimonadota bacterium]
GALGKGVRLAILETRSLRFAYPDGTEALRGVDLVVEEGSFLAVLGPNGSGKTTLFHHLNGLLRPSSGEVLLRGESLAKLSPLVVHSTVGLVFQDPESQLFAPTVAEDVAFGPRNLNLPRAEVQRRVEEALERLGIASVAHKRVHSLSFGQKKRAAIAGVLAMRPAVMILDEPTAGLDPVGAEQLMDLLAALNRSLGMTILLGTHDVDVVPAYAGDVVVLKQGEVLASGPPRAVFSRPDVVESARLRLPYVAQLVQAVRQRRGEAQAELPLTVPEAVEELVSLLSSAAIGPESERRDRPTVAPSSW